MAIDNPYDAINLQYPVDESGGVNALAKIVIGAKELGIPAPPIVAQFFGFLNNKSKRARDERGLAFVQLLVEDIQKHEDKIAAMRTDMKDIQAAMNMALEYDVNEFDDRKRNRYVLAITQAISSETRVAELASFIQDIEKLGDRDLVGLKVLNRIMNKPGDWQEGAPRGPLTPIKLHPNTFIHRAQEFSLQMTQALTGKTEQDGNVFSREEGLQICLRLQGFGLAEMISVSPREVPISNYAARLTTRGLMLLKLLGENVPNWQYYFGPDGPRP